MNQNWPKITLETTMEELQAIHKRIWDCAIEYGEKPITPYACNCVGCERCDMMRCICDLCPIIWPDGITCDMEGSLFQKWWKTRDPALAQQIRDLPFKPYRYLKEETK